MPCSHFLWFHTSSISYFSSSLIISGNGAIFMYYSLNWGSLYCISKSLLNILCIAYSSSNFSWNTSLPMSFVISKGPYLFWSNFFEDYFDWIFLISSYMLFSCFNSWGFCFFLSNCFFIASFVFSIDVFTISQFLCSSLSKVSSFDNFIFIRSLFYKYLPKLSSNSIYLVVECFLLLYWNSTADNHSI